jgi:hypothetical protein
MVSRDEPQAEADLSPRARDVGRVLWCSFLAACIASIAFFAFVDPAIVSQPDVPPSSVSGKIAAYSAGFFFFWGTAALGSGLTAFLMRADRSRGRR